MCIRDRITPSAGLVNNFGYDPFAAFLSGRLFLREMFSDFPPRICYDGKLNC